MFPLFLYVQTHAMKFYNRNSINSCEKLFLISKLKSLYMEKYEKLKQLVSEVQEDSDKFYKANNNAAGTRVRKAMQEIKVLATEIRKEITEKKNKK